MNMASREKNKKFSVKRFLNSFRFSWDGLKYVYKYEQSMTIHLACTIFVIILGICLCVGYIIKNAITTDKINKYIPLIVGCLGLILAIVSDINHITLNTVLTGLLSGLASTGLYEAFKNLFMKEGE